MKLERIMCPICGSKHFNKTNDDYICECCDARFRYHEEESRQDFDSIRRISSEADAESYLKMSPPRFDDAQDKFEVIKNDYPDWFVGYWGFIRSKYGIKYELDHSGKAIPSCYKGKYQDFRTDPDFIKAVQYAETDELKNKLISEAGRISSTWKEWEERAKKLDYDIFLSFKTTDENGNETIDKREMGDLYTFLVENGYKVFYSPVTMRKFTGAPYYDAYIFNALEKAKVLIVYGSKPEYFSTTWVSNEWNRYLKQIERGEKKDNSLIVVYRGFNPTIDLPRKLSGRQCYDGSLKTFFPDVLQLINNLCKEEPKIENDNKEEKEELVDNNDLENNLEVNDIEQTEYISSKIDLKVEIATEFSYIDFHADGLYRAKKDLAITPFSFIKSIEIINDTGEIIPGLAISFSFDNEAFSIEDVVLPPCPSPAGFVRIPWLRVKKPLIDHLTERIPCGVTIRLISTYDEKEIAIVRRAFHVLPISQPTEHIYNERRLLAKYVTPLAPAVKQIANKAVLYNNGNPIIAYQNTNINDMVSELQSIYLSLHEENILYQNPPANDSFAQRVRMPEESTRDKKATCLDSSILFCSVLEEVGYHPFLVLIDGHAFCGVFLTEKDSFDGGFSDKLSDVVDKISRGSQTVILIETTFITSSYSMSFQNAMDTGKNHLTMYEGTIFFAIDINTCHSGMIFSPIPTEGNDYDLENYIKQKEIEEKDLNPIINDNREYEKVESQFEMTRFKTWERKLLDLSEKNRLVSFFKKSTNANINSCVRLLSNDNIIQLLLDFDEIELSMLATTQGEVAATYMKVDESVFRDALLNLPGGSLAIFGLEKTFKNIISKAKSALEETGASPLYLSLGMIDYLSPKSHSRIKAPFFLLPISIKRASGGKKYIMSYDVGDLRINETFFEFYKMFNRDVNFNSILDFDDISKYYDVAHTFKEISDSNLALEENYFFISNLSFAHQVMWLDMVKRKEELKKNIIVKSIVDNQSYLTDEVISDDEPVEQLENYKDFAAPLYYDSSQLKAILDCGAGKSFILDGPPGTGKSQTIVNMIANAFYNGKKILFVAEKKAALDVVADRLRKLGLGNYCLELHSNKATKADFFTKLGAVMDFGPTKTVDEYQQKCQELTVSKNWLRKKINKMHDDSQYIMSLYDCIVAIKQFNYLEKYKIDFSREYMLNFSKEKYDICTKLIDTYISFAKGVHNFDSTPLKVFGIQKINFINDRRIVLEEISNSIVVIKKYLESIQKFVSTLSFQIKPTNENYDAIINLFDFALNNNLFANSINDLLGPKEEIEKSFSMMEDMILLREKYNEQYDIDKLITNVDINSVASILRNAKGIFKRIKAQKYVKSALQPYVKNPINNRELGYIIIQITEYIKQKNKLLLESKQFERITKLNAYDSLDNIEEIKKTYEDTKDFIKLVVDFAKNNESDFIISYFIELANSKNTAIRFNYDLVCDSISEYRKVDELLVNKYLINKEVLSAKGDYFKELLRALNYASDPEVFNDLVDLTNVNQLNNGFEQEGLYSLIKCVLIGNCRVNELHELLRVSLAYGFLSLYFEDEDINLFSPAYIDSQINSYKNALKEYSEITVQCISAKISEDFVRSDIKYSSSGAIGRLKKAIANNGRGVSIRGILSEFGNIILKYFPCFLMSPLSAAQYLSVNSDEGKAFSKFDIVIFDEASQIPTHEAIGPIARGNSLIVAGDPKQMPPSPYFSAGLQVSDEEDDENDAIKFSDSPSLLDECISIEMPRHRLLYHYRSKHESLIQFSNDNFYNSGLYTFPSSSISTSCVEFEYVTTKVPKSDSSLSEEELQKILSIFVNIYKNPETANKSVGIISFNIKQADKIIDSLNELLGNDKELALIVDNAVEKTKEPWFVKSIENVQGDERDIIILSVGFSLAKSGYPNIRGPLVAGDNNGERRLNVAASRSKEKMIVVSTIKASQFPDDSQIKNPGSKCLKHFLKYAENCSFNKSNGHPVDESSILYYIKSDLEERGFSVDTNVGNSEFRVDIALKNNASNHYDLGILIDTKPINNEISCRDKLYLQGAVLNSMKWKIITIYSLEYYKYPKTTIDKIVNAYYSDYVENKNELNINIQKEDISKIGDVYAMDTYKEILIPNLHYSNDDGYNGKELCEFIKFIIDNLSPVSFNEIKTYVSRACGFKVLNDIRENRLIKILNINFSDQREFDQTQYFYWKSDCRVIEKFRRSCGRSVYDISKEEIACAMKQIYKIQYGISQEDLYKQLMDVLDFNTRAVTKYYKERFDEAYEYAKEKEFFN